MKPFLAATLIASLSLPVVAEIQTRVIPYTADGITMNGYLAYDDAAKAPRPGVIVVHEWWGQNAYARQRAVQLAQAGYVGFAIDMYGEGKTADHPKDAGAFAKAALANADGAIARFQAGLDSLKTQPEVDASHLSAIGYCFGGGVVLNMARQGLPLYAVASFHGSLGPLKAAAQKGGVNAKILVANGAADPLVSAESIDAFKVEMDAAGVSYEFINYPGAKHGFSNPEATANGEKFGLPLAYDKAADADSWDKLMALLKAANAP